MMREAPWDTSGTRWDHPARRRWALVFASVWLVYLAQPIGSTLHADRPIVVRVVGISLTAVFIAVYISGMAAVFAARARPVADQTLGWTRAAAATLVAIAVVMPWIAGISPRPMWASQSCSAPPARPAGSVGALSSAG